MSNFYKNTVNYLELKFLFLMEKILIVVKTNKIAPANKNSFGLRLFLPLNLSKTAIKKRKLKLRLQLMYIKKQLGILV